LASRSEQKRSGRERRKKKKKKKRKKKRESETSETKQCSSAKWFTLDVRGVRAELLAELVELLIVTRSFRFGCDTNLVADLGEESFHLQIDRQTLNRTEELNKLLQKQNLRIARSASSEE
jgi:hypothetical protein